MLSSPLAVNQLELYSFAADCPQPWRLSAVAADWWRKLATA